MMHIGYRPWGSGWGGLAKPREELCAQLGIRVPFDAVSPLAPFGGMWIGRPEALRLAHAASAGAIGDYGKRGSVIATATSPSVQERLVAYAAAELGYHARTVLTRARGDQSHGPRVQGRQALLDDARLARRADPAPAAGGR